MRRLLTIVLLATSLAMPAGVALAQDASYEADDVVDFFVKDQEQLGAARGICVGTAEECNAEAKPSAFDVLVNFELDSATLTDEAIANLTQVAAALTDPRLDGARFVIEGHTDATGSETYNKELADRRAASVEEFLLGKGVSRERMTAIGMGELSPRVTDPFDPINRRVEMRLNLE
jgi:outer membrane protein OmpA-like peptidoglycan-associated protein